MLTDIDLLHFGNLKKIDLHGLTKAEAEFELLSALNLVDTGVNGIIIVHGYHSGQILQSFVRKEFNHELIAKKINIDPSRTLYLIDWEYSIKK